MGAQPHPLRAWRKQRRLTLRDISHLTGHDIATVSRAERGLSVPKWETRVHIARCLRVAVGDLFYPLRTRDGQP